MSISVSDASAKIAGKRGGESPTTYPIHAMRPSSRTAGGNKLAPSSNADIIALRHLYMPSAPTTPSETQDISMGVDSSNDQAIYLSVLEELSRRSFNIELREEHHRLSSLMDINAASQAHIRPHETIPAIKQSSTQSQVDSTAIAPSRRRKPNFAEKLHSVLSSKDCRVVVTWSPLGGSFCIKDREEFVQKILPKHFREAKFESFCRRLKRWGFRKVSDAGLNQIIFAHDVFHRDKPELCKLMNGREKTTAVEISPVGGTVPSHGFAAGPVVSQWQLHSTMASPQLLRQQTDVQHPMRHLQDTMLGTLHGSLRSTSSSPKEASTLQDISKAQSMAAPPKHGDTPSYESHQQVAIKDASPFRNAQALLTRLGSDLVNCEEQLAILGWLKELKEARCQMKGASGSRGSPPIV